MTVKPLCVVDGTPVDLLLSAMRQHRVRVVLVTRPGRAPGVLTYNQAVRRAADGGGPLVLERTVLGGPASVRPDDLIGTAIEVMRSRGVWWLPVCRDGEPVGIVTWDQVAPGRP